MNEFDKFDHVVVLMLENRSFDNLLGYLYKDGVPNGKKFEGLQDGHSNPVPPAANGFNEHPIIAAFAGKDSDQFLYSQPFPDPGEEYQHVNTQLFGTIIPDSNEGKDAFHMEKPYNVPKGIAPNTDLGTPLAPLPPMNGFIKDYISNLLSSYNKTEFEAGYDQYKVIMQCFTPEQIPVLTGLAKSFAVFDHWHCSVPTQTWCNRAFWHAASSGGKVINPLEEGDAIGHGGVKEDAADMDAWTKSNWEKDTLFSRMCHPGWGKKKVSWKVYSQIPVISLTAMVNGEFCHRKDFDCFFHDVEKNKLPAYSFLEPKFTGMHNDQHPSAINHELDTGTVLLGEELIWQVYESIRKSPQRDKILFIITYDEHGGCFDHVAPSSAVPPDSTVGQFGFPFDRLGVRVPMVMVSSWIQPNTIVNETFDHTSFIRTACEKWNLEGLTERDKHASVFVSPKLFGEEKRTDPWPELPYPLSPESKKMVDLVALEFEQGKIENECVLKKALADAPLNGLQSSIKIGLLYYEKINLLGRTEPDSILTNGQLVEFTKKLERKNKTVLRRGIRFFKDLWCVFF